jgi:CheY-like chemotaxis protein
MAQGKGLAREIHRGPCLRPAHGGARSTRTASPLALKLKGFFAAYHLQKTPVERRSALAASAKPRSPLVLVVEDEPEAAELLQSILERRGCEVIVARDGGRALEITRELPQPDLVLLDLELPVLDGRKLLEVMRSDPSLSGIPVVVVSGADDVTSLPATDAVRKSRLLDGLSRVFDRLRT